MTDLQHQTVWCVYDMHNTAENMTKEKYVMRDSYRCEGAKIPTIFLHSYSLFWNRPSCHCSNQPSLPIQGLAFRWNGSFHLGLLEPSCHVRSVSTQGTVPMEATWRGPGRWQSVCRRVRCQRGTKPPDMWGKKPPWKGVLWPRHPSWWHVDQS